MPLRLPKNKRDLKLIPYDFEYDLNTGNDVIHGGDGNDLLIGDFGAVIVPVVLDTPANQKEAKQLQKDVAYLVHDLEHLLRGKHDHDYYVKFGKELFEGRFNHDHLRREGSDRKAVLSAGNDGLYGDAGNDVILADNAAFVVPFAADTGTLPVLAKKSSFDLKGVAGDFMFKLGHPDYSKRMSVLSSDSIEGGSGDDVLLGEQGRDVLNGGVGDDQLYGGKGKDTLLGGGGSDVFKQGGSNKPGKSMAVLIQNLFFAALSPQMEQFLLDVAATGGVLHASGNVFIISANGTTRHRV